MSIDAIANALSRTIADAPTVGDPTGPDEMLALLRFLHATGRRDLPLGRLVEGHVDAMQIVTRYGIPTLAHHLGTAAQDGRVRLGVWNAPLPDAPLTLRDGHLHGGKSFASGAGILSHALVTVGTDDDPQLVLVDLARTPAEIDTGWWKVVGMQRSETHRVRWRDTAIGPDDLVGAAGDYRREPWFSGGALRFAAVQAGGIAALCDHVRDHLVARSRDGDPHQRGRLAGLFEEAQHAAAAVADAGRRWFDDDTPTKLARVAAARAAVYAAGDRAMAVAQQAVGLDGLFVGHPLSAAITDLAVYLRQPSPDAQRMRVGEAVAVGLLTPTL